MKVKSAKVISEVQKVRFLVMDMIYHNPDHSVMIPSSNELAAHFGIARYTVRLALEKMTKEGFLFTKRGTGTFTVPQSVKNGSEKIPLIGIRIGTGDQFYYDSPLLHELGTIFQIAANRNCNVRLLTDSADNIEDFERILDNAYIDALISISVFSEFSSLAAKRMPVVSIGFESEEAASIIYGADKVVDQLLKQPRAKSKLSILSVCEEFDLKLLYKAFSNNPDIDFVCEPQSFQNEESVLHFKQAVNRIMPDIICTRNSHLYRTEEIIVEMNIPSNCCRFLKVEASDPHSFDNGMRLKINLNKVLNLAMDEAMCRIAGDNNKKPSCHVIDYDLIIGDKIRS